MKAIRFDRYGPPGVLELRDVPVPTVGDDEVLVRVHAAGLNPQDWHLMVGLPWFMRAQTGVRRPTVTGLGSDLAGTIEAVGDSVGGFAPGDQVFGRVGLTPGTSSIPALGAVAELVAVPAAAVRPLPDGLTHVEAASLPLVGITALQGFRDFAPVSNGDHVLVNGASGGVGTAAVQIAKAMGAEVTGVCSTRNVDLVRSLGADHVVDHTRDDPTRGEARYDAVLDNVGNHGASAWRRTLAPEGIWLVSFDHPHRTVGGPVRSALWGALSYLPFSQRVVLLTQTRREEDMDDLTALVETGRLRPTVDRTFDIADTAAAIDYLQTRRARGKVVITVEEA